MYPSEQSELRQLSARLGRNPFLVQAASGNTSLKLGSSLWIKASGMWLAHAEDTNIFVRVDRKGGGNASGAGPEPSIETAMHLALPHRVVIHVHSVNAISWAVEADGARQVGERLAGLAWAWIPYVESGVPLARAVSSVPADIYILANHGLVVAAESCAAAEELLQTVERRLHRECRACPEGDRDVLDRLARGGEWLVPDSSVVHTLATDAVSKAIVTGGTLYPCHGLFLGPGAAENPADYQSRHGTLPSFLLVKGAGVLVSRRFDTTQMEVLIGLARVVQRISAASAVRYLAPEDLDAILCSGGYAYRELATQQAVDSELMQNTCR